MRWFCTYFDTNYMTRGLALYASLVRWVPRFRLAVICLDEPCREILEKLSLPYLTLFSLEDLERFDPDLLVAKSNRNRLEYYYTLTPAIILFALQEFSEADMVTYLDSDIFFFNSPEPLFEELGKDAVSIIEHRFPPHLAAAVINGIYNVAWLTFRRDERALTCLHWWREKCLEWCYEILEEKRFADQKYLDDWPDRFTGVTVLQHKGANVAPWNLSKWTVTLENGNVRIDEQGLIFFHFHRFREMGAFAYDANLLSYGAHATPAIRKGILEPYVRAISAEKTRVSQFLTSNKLDLGLRKKDGNGRRGLVARCKEALLICRKALNGDLVFALTFLKGRASN
jgi:hypothetical protein